MNNPNKLSHTKINLFQECPLKYKLHYIDKLRSETIDSPLVFGSAIDDGINELLLSRDLQSAIKKFLDKLYYPELNRVKLDLHTKDSLKVNFRDDDYVKEILTEEDQISVDLGIDKHLISLQRKGIIVLTSYEEFVLPKIAKVIELQKRISVKNEAGDELEGALDAIIELHNGMRYLIDHKTTTKQYEKDSAGKSLQLLIYNHVLEEYKLDGVGFIVLNKALWLRKTKICSVCAFDGSGSSHRTCNNMIDNKRCNAAWNVKVNPKCFIDLIFNKPNERIANMALDVIDGVNKSIKDNNFAPNLSSCIRGKRRCIYYDYCHNGKKDGLTIVKPIIKD